MGCPKTSFHHSRSRALQWPDGTSKVIPVDTLKVELQYYCCRQDKVYSWRECKQSPVCTSVQFQLLWQILSSRESWWQQVSRFWALRPKQYETKRCGVMWGKGCAIFCFLQPLLLDGVPHPQPEAMWDDRDLKKKKKGLHVRQVPTAQTHPDEY